MAMTPLVLDHSTAPSDLGARFLRARPGPEEVLVRGFIDELPLASRPGWRTTIFREPRLDSGFPDIVIVHWSVAVTLKWHLARRTLTLEDIRLLHYLSLSGSAPDEALRALFGSSVGHALTRLQSAGAVRHTRDTWRSAALSQLLAVRRIIAIEAKIREWGAAIDQAVLNTWFATDSYVLVPAESSSPRLLAAAKAAGVGVWAGTTLALAPRKLSAAQPRSYASWLFNEWAWRAAIETGPRE